MAAHSTTRRLCSTYNDPLYQVIRQSDGKTLDIGFVKPTKDNPGGYADAVKQDAFLINTLGWITQIYDQSGKGNDLIQVPPGTFKGPAKGAFNTLPIADMAPVTINGHKAYGVYIIPGIGLRDNNAKDIAINDEAEGIYYVINGKHYSSGCCFDYGTPLQMAGLLAQAQWKQPITALPQHRVLLMVQGPGSRQIWKQDLFSGYNAKKMTSLLLSERDLFTFTFRNFPN